MGDWPRTTAVQREFIRRIESSRHKALRFGPRERQTVYALFHKGFVKTFGPFDGVELTQRGRDYFRFGMSRKKAST